MCFYAFMWPLALRRRDAAAAAPRGASPPARSLSPAPPSRSRRLIPCPSCTAAIAKQLVSTLLKDGIKVKDESLWEAAMYNPPWTLPWLKTNEVYVPLADGQNFQS